jgi:transposase
MAIEKHYSLRQAAKLIGISRSTLKRWMAADLAIVLPRLGHGHKVLIRERDLEIVLRKHTATSDWTLLRGGRRAGGGD